MRYALNLPNFADYADVRKVAALAAEAEAAGWDGFFVWDHMVYDKRQRLPVADPWILLAAVALATERLRLGPMVTPLARRRPWKVARETVTLDHLSGGRLILGVGLGTPAVDEYGTFGEPTDARVRAARLDEGLEVLTRLWSGETVSFHGEHYRLDEVAFQPTPLQRPRIPIFVAGAWPRRAPWRRAARYDGVVPVKVAADGDLGPLTPDDLTELLAIARAHRPGGEPLEVMVDGETPGGDPEAALAVVEPLAEAGMTWWTESLEPRRGGLEELRARVRQGPPRR
jgi:alkanesulfonate monooxygenase SsuD/methylene tetrahydromethanopterin reductase-like flavin-dependent oxidoreductase (luciferase family)